MQVWVPVFYLMTLSLPVEGLFGRVAAPASVAATALACIAATAALSRWACSRAVDPGPARAPAVRRYYRLRSAAPWAGAAIFFLLVVGAGWGSTVRDAWGLGGLVLVDEALILLPWAIVVGVWVAAAGRVDAAIRRGLSGGPGEPVERPVEPWTAFWREYGLWILMGALLLAARDAASAVWPAALSNSPGGLVFIAAVLLVGLSLLPLMIQCTWDVRPPPQPLTESLHAAAAAWNLALPAILLWRPTSGAANALATGVWPGLRLVLLSETLVACLETREVVAVFGHELGHLGRRHALWYWLVAMGVVSLAVVAAGRVEDVLAGVGGPAGSWIASEAPLSVLLGLPSLVLLLGAVKRRFERQADVAGCRTASWLVARESGSQAGDLTVTPGGVALFRESLRKVADFNGFEEWDRTPLGANLAARGRFLDALARDPRLADRFDSATAWRVRATVGLLFAAAGLLGLLA
jgi:Zn-dependent protease with chaperone function